MAHILQKTILNVFPSMKIFEFQISLMSVRKGPIGSKVSIGSDYGLVFVEMFP